MIIRHMKYKGTDITLWFLSRGSITLFNEVGRRKHVLPCGWFVRMLHLDNDRDRFWRAVEALVVKDPPAKYHPALEFIGKDTD